jgi:RNA polymerase sigma factor (sigma-70 family)
MTVVSDLLYRRPGLYDEIMNQARSLCRTYARDSADLEDLLGDAWEIALSRGDTLKDPLKIVPWYLSIARNHCLDMVKQRKRELSAVARFSLDFRLLFGAGVDDKPVLRMAREDEIESLEISLPRSERDALFLRSLQKTYGEIGEALGISEDAAEKRCRRGAAKLKSRCEEIMRAYEDRDEPPELPPEMRVTTGEDMRRIVAEMRSRGSEVSESEEADLLRDLPKRRDWQAKY